MRKFPLRRREVEQLLRANGSTIHRQHGSHIRYVGVIDGVTVYPELDQTIDEYPPYTRRVLGNILAQLRFIDDDRGIDHAVAWERFFAGEQSIARRAGITYRPWSDPYWAQWYQAE